MADDNKTAMQQEIAIMIIEALNLEETTPDGIELDAPLFHDGLGLDSIDALELSLEITQRYGFQLKSDDPDIGQVFASLRTLTKTIENRREG